MAFAINQFPTIPDGIPSADGVVEGLQKLGELGVAVLLLIFLIIVVVTILVLGTFYLRAWSKRGSQDTKTGEVQASTNAEIVKQLGTTVTHLGEVSKEMLVAFTRQTVASEEANKTNQDFLAMIELLAEHIKDLPGMLAESLTAGVKIVADNNLKYYNEKQMQITQAISDLEKESGTMNTELQAVKDGMKSLLDWTKEHSAADETVFKEFRLMLNSMDKKLDQLLKIHDTQELPIVDLGKDTP